MTIKRLDPWSVLKFGAFASVVLYAVFLLVAGVVWFIVDRLQLVDQACDIALDVGFTSCGVNAGNLFQVLALLGGMSVIVQTAILVFLAFLHNLIADLTGGLVIGVIDDGAADATSAARNAAPITASSLPSGRSVPAGSGGIRDDGHAAQLRGADERRPGSAERPRGEEAGPDRVDEPRDSTPESSSSGPTADDERLFR